MDEGLARLAAAQGGVLTTADARNLGVGDDALARLVARGELCRVRQAAYAVSDPAQGAAARFASRVRAVLASRHGRAWASHHAGLVVHGLPLHGVDLGHIDLVARVRGRSSRSGVWTRPLEPTETTLRVGGLPVCSTATCLVGTTAASGVEPGVVAMDAALRAGLVSLDDLTRRADELGRAWGVGRVRAALRLLDPASESVGESRTRLLLHALGIVVRSQVTVRDETGAFVARVDFLVDGAVVVEFDGAVKYADAEGRAALVAEKRREDRLRALGYEVVRLTWSDLTDPARVARLLREARWRADRAPATGTARVGRASSGGVGWAGS